MLDIVLRTCDHSDVHPERGLRFINVDKTILIKKCFISLLTAIDNAKDICDIKLWILDDHSDTSLLDYLSDKCKEYELDYKIISLEGNGFNYSALSQFEYCRDKGRVWVYSVEDDYFHLPMAIKNMLIMGEKFKTITGTEIALKPDDDPFTYSHNADSSMKPCRLLLGNDRHWRTCCNSHNTIFTSVTVFSKYWELFASLAKYFKKLPVNEDNTINMLWNDGVQNQGPIPLFSPLPTLAMHISQGNEPHFLNYKSLWDNTEV